MDYSFPKKLMMRLPAHTCLKDNSPAFDSLKLLLEEEICNWPGSQAKLLYQWWECIR
ncbi:MAG: hypothetical protein ACJAS1_001304 [Oleiphilaceae bacterium]|jgi:hypothetical protein